MSAVAKRPEPAGPTEPDLLAIYRRLTPCGKAAVMRMVARDESGMSFKENMKLFKREAARLRRKPPPKPGK